MATPRPAQRFGNGTQRFVPGSGGNGFTRLLPRPIPAPPSASRSVSSIATPSRATQMGLGLGKGLGKGKGAVGLGTKGLLKRHKKLQRDTIQGITKGDIRRLARRGGIKRISAMVYEDVRDALRERIRTILRDIVAIVESDNRKTVVVQDVIFTLNRLGWTIYGFDAAFNGRSRKG
ncbi:histone-fold-containing protein [Bimuria novae-zelandiae CBS 107.79]|uniref:Histone H4 n=1 Tax=Bimuria novae-zelandiae CBS 107.79 TaxID=1447943 RepID=A0A6A5UKG5_9PLEO|nr:histone-fold-containing protein [Bimuria novae-zelandiae CBS 107.79]